MVGGELVITYTETTPNGLIEVEEHEDGMRVEILVEPSEEYLNERASELVLEPSPPEPNQDDYLLDLDYRLSMNELGL